MRWQSARNLIRRIGTWSLLGAGAALAVELLRIRRLRRQAADLSSDAAAGGRGTESVPETRFQERDETHKSGARYD